MRPLFPKDYRNDVTLENLVMSVDQDCSPELTAMLGAAIATSISDIPFDGPISTTQVGLSMTRHVKIAFSEAFPSLLLNPPGIFPTA